MFSVFLTLTYFLFFQQEKVHRNKKKIIRVILILLIWTQFARYAGVFLKETLEWNIWIFHFRIDAFSLGSYLPFYICRVSALVLLYYWITKDKRVESFLFYWGSLGLAGVLFPNGPISNIFNLDETFYIDHILLALIPYYLLVYEGYKPTKKGMYITTAIMFSILMIFIPINQFLDTIPSVGSTVDYFYVSDQSIVGDLFPGLPSYMFVVIHTFAAYLFFNLYYYIFRHKEYEIRELVKE